MRFELVYDQLNMGEGNFPVSPSAFHTHDKKVQVTIAKRLFNEGLKRGSNDVKKLCQSYLEEL